MIENIIELNEFEKIIYEQLKEMQTENTLLNNKFKELKKLFEQYSHKTELHKYSEASAYFRHLNSIRSEAEEIKILSQLKEKVEEITMLLTKNTDELNYVFYFTDKKGHIYRSKMTKIPLKYMEIDNSSGQLQIAKTALTNKLRESKTKQDVTAHFNTYLKTLQDTYRGQTFPNKRLNYGIFAEAFERHLNNVHAGALASNQDISIESGYDWTVNEAWRLVRQSLGDDPWYTGGDVGGSQVKNISSTSTRLTKQSTLEDIISFLLYVGQPYQNEQVLLKQAKEAARILYNEANDVVKQGIDTMTDEELNKFLNSAAMQL